MGGSHLGGSRIRSGVLIALAIGTFALWIPVVVWVLSPDRTSLLGYGGRYLVYWTIALQIVAVAVGLVLTWNASAWSDRRARRASLILGGVAWVGMEVWAYWVAFSIRPFPLERGPDDWAVFAAILLVALAPVVVPPSRSRIRWTLSVVVAVIVLGVSWALVLAQPMPHLVGPTTLYVVLTVASGAVARSADGGSGTVSGPGAR